MMSGRREWGTLKRWAVDAGGVQLQTLASSGPLAHAIRVPVEDKISIIVQFRPFRLHRLWRSKTYGTSMRRGTYQPILSPRQERLAIEYMRHNLRAKNAKVQVVNILGDPSKPGPYAQLLKVFRVHRTVGRAALRHDRQRGRRCADHRHGPHGHGLRKRGRRSDEEMMEAGPVARRHGA